MILVDSSRFSESDIIIRLKCFKEKFWQTSQKVHAGVSLI